MMAICLEDDHTTAIKTRKVEINKEQGGINNEGPTALVFRVKVDVAFVYHGCIR